MGSEHLQNLDVNRGHEPEMRKSLEINERTLRFMERASNCFHCLVTAKPAVSSPG